MNSSAVKFRKGDRVSVEGVVSCGPDGGDDFVSILIDDGPPNRVRPASLTLISRKFNEGDKVAFKGDKGGFLGGIWEIAASDADHFMLRREGHYNTAHASQIDLYEPPAEPAADDDGQHADMIGYQRTIDDDGRLVPAPNSSDEV